MIVTNTLPRRDAVVLEDTESSRGEHPVNSIGDPSDVPRDGSCFVVRQIEERASVSFGDDDDMRGGDLTGKNEGEGLGQLFDNRARRA